MIRSPSPAAPDRTERRARIVHRFGRREPSGSGVAARCSCSFVVIRDSAAALKAAIDAHLDAAEGA